MGNLRKGVAMVVEAGDTQVDIYTYIKTSYL
jgi:hypothetical protein